MKVDGLDWALRRREGRGVDSEGAFSGRNGANEWYFFIDRTGFQRGPNLQNVYQRRIPSRE